MTEKRKFQMHEKLLLDVIKRQAGSLQKAVLEGVMNSIEAGSKKVEVTLSSDKLCIDDSGRGFRNKKEVEDWFETFGQPHKESENKKWAQFRMGRGQLFAFGQNMWRTGEFQMDVDIEQRLGYDLKAGLSHHDGCRVEVQLYSPISDREISYTSREIATYVKYVSVPVIVNGVEVNTSPENEKWGKESNEDAYIKLTDSSRGVEIYNLGVFVCRYPVYEFGTSGIVVTKKRIDVNFARNDVIKSCPVYKRIKSVIDKSEKVGRNRQKKELSDEERINLVDRILSKELEFDDYKASKIFVDTNGYAWSYQSIKRGRFQNWSIARRNSQKAGMLLKRGTLVISEGCFDIFDTKPEELMDKLFGYRLLNFRYIPFDTLSQDIDNNVFRIPMSQWTPTMHMWEEVIRSMQSSAIGWGLRSVVDQQRQIMFMSSASFLAITDGETHISFGKEFVESLPLIDRHNQNSLSLKSLLKVGEVLIHELAHHEQTSGDHAHGPEFDLSYRTIMENGALTRAVSEVMGKMSNPVKIAQLKKRCAERHRKAKKMAINDAASDKTPKPKTPKKKAKKKTSKKETPKAPTASQVPLHVCRRIFEQRNLGTTWQKLEKDFRLKPAKGMTAVHCYKKWEKERN